MSSTEAPAGLDFADPTPSRDIATIAATAVMGLDFAAYDNPDVAAHRHGQIQEAVQAALREAGVATKAFPLTLTDELRDVLGIPNFQAGPMAHAFRDAGRAEIKRRSEDEQAFVLHWLVGLVLEHGADWRRHAGVTLGMVAEEAKAANAKREAERAARG